MCKLLSFNSERFYNSSRWLLLRQLRRKWCILCVWCVWKGHDPCHHSWTDNNNNINIKGSPQKNKKIKRKTSCCPHTWTDGWSLGNAAQTHRSSDGQRWIWRKNKRLSWSVDHSETMTENKETLKRPVLFPSLLCLQQWQCAADMCDVKWTTARALWWRIVYWSGSMCLCERFDGRATSTPLWPEGKLLFLALPRCSAFVSVCVCVCLFLCTHRHQKSAQGVQV